MAGEGELRDLSPGGCRVTSSLQSPLGSSWSVVSSRRMKATPLPSKAQRFAGAVLRNSELAFTKVRPGVQRQIAQLCQQGHR